MITRQLYESIINYDLCVILNVMAHKKIRAACLRRRPLSGMGDPVPRVEQHKDTGFRPSKQCAVSFPAGARSVLYAENYPACNSPRISPSLLSFPASQE